MMLVLDILHREKAVKILTAHLVNSVKLLPSKLSLTAKCGAKQLLANYSFLLTTSLALNPSCCFSTRKSR